MAVLTKDGHFVIDPVRLGAFFREYAAIEQTPDLQTTIELVRALGIDIKAVEYLETGGVNMAARGLGIFITQIKINLPPRNLIFFTSYSK